MCEHVGEKAYNHFKKSPHTDSKISKFVHDYTNYTL